VVAAVAEPRAAVVVDAVAAAVLPGVLLRLVHHLLVLPVAVVRQVLAQVDVAAQAVLVVLRAPRRLARRQEREAMVVDVAAVAQRLLRQVRGRSPKVCL